MGRAIGDPDNRLRNIIAAQRREPLVDLGGSLGVAVEADLGELGADGAGVDGRDPDGGVDQIEAQSLEEGIDGIWWRSRRCRSGRPRGRRLTLY